MSVTVMPALLLGASLAAPVGFIFACLSRRLRERVPSLLWLAPLPALVAALFGRSRPRLVLDQPLYHVTLALDGPGAMLLGVVALLWIGAGGYASAYLCGKPRGGRFAVYWLLTLTGCLGVFMAADLWSFFVLFTVVSLAAYGLVVHDGTPRARRAGVIYLALAVLGEACVLMGFVLLAAATPGRSLLIRDAVAALPASPWRDPTLALLIAGFGIKAGLVPLHVWLPLAHPAAPMPASAVLSGAIIKAGIIGLIRFLPFEAALLGWGAALTVAGLLSAFYGVVVGITQANPKTVLAYSSVSQMGLITVVLGMGLVSGDESAAMGAAFYAARHVLVKGALFLAVGVVAATGSRRLWPVLLPTAVLALSLGGLPLTGGTLAKLAVKGPLGEGVVATLATFSAIGTTLLMLHFLHRLAPTAGQDPEQTAPAGLTSPWFALALVSLVVPVALYPATGIGSLADALAPAALWAALRPILIGGVLAVGLLRWGRRLPPVPEGDIVVAGEAAVRASVAWGAAVERAETALRRWPVACLSLLIVAIILGMLMLAGR